MVVFFPHIIQSNARKHMFIAKGRVFVWVLFDSAEQSTSHTDVHRRETLSVRYWWARTRSTVTDTKYCYVHLIVDGADREDRGESFVWMRVLREWWSVRIVTHCERWDDRFMGWTWCLAWWLDFDTSSATQIVGLFWSCFGKVVFMLLGFVDCNGLAKPNGEPRAGLVITNVIKYSFI